MENINSWKDIRWSDVEQRIFRLQLRIYKAAANQELEKVYKLQKLLVKSKYAKYLAVRKVTQDNTGKKTPGVDKRLITSSSQRFTLANQLELNGKSSPILRMYIPAGPGKQRPLGIPTIEDRAKQMLAYLAMCPQWEAKFEAESYGFRPGRSVNDAMEAVFLGIAKKPKWVLDADISKCFDKINHKYLINKCETYPEMRKQIRAWLKAGILEGEEFAFPEMGTPQGGIISPLLANIALHGLTEHIYEYINSLGGNRRANRQTTTYVRYADDFVVMHPDKQILLNLVEEIKDFLKPIGLELHPIKTRITYTLVSTDGPSGFTFLGFDVIQRKKWVRMRKAFTKQNSNQTFITLITPSKEGIRKHKLKLREIIRKHRGASQERLIHKLNPVIRGFALSKRSQIASRIFQDLDKYVYEHLWTWARRRHPKMSGYKLKAKYWHTIENRNWVFGVQTKEEVTLQLQYHSKIPIIRHVKVKGTASPFDGNLIYWATRTGKTTLIPPIKANLIKEQKGKCGLCGKLFLPEDIIERDHIIPKAFGGLNRKDNVHVVHNYCHREKTNAEMAIIRRNRKRTK
jgi:RNA-directed DNA polymerase